MAISLPIMAAAAQQTVIYDHSNIICASRQMGVPVEAEFKRFTAQIDFDPAQPEAGKIQITIDTDSFEFDAEVDDEVRGRLWLDAHNFPQARFLASAVRALGNGRYEARGTLTIKGTSADIVAPFTYRPDANDDGLFEGAFTISRLYFNIGEGQWRDTDTVADNVQVKFQIAARTAVVAKKK